MIFQCIGDSISCTGSKMSFTSRGWTNPTDQIQQELVDEVNWIVMKVGFCSKQYESTWRTVTYTIMWSMS